MTTVEPNSLERARAAYRRGDYASAATEFANAEVHGIALELGDRVCCAQLALLTGDTGRAIALTESAFEEFRRQLRIDEAAGMALWMFRMFADRGESTLSRSWLRRAEGMLQGNPLCAAHAQIEIIRAFQAQKELRFDEAMAHAVEAERIAVAVGAEDARVLAVNRRGRLLLKAGRMQEGLALIDEAMLSVNAGSITPGYRFIVYCSTIDGCTDVADYTRASEWTEAATEWCEANAFDGVPGVCRVHRAALMRLRGDWEMAAAEAHRACEILERVDHGAAQAYAMGEVGNIRLHAGDLDAADVAFRAAHAGGHEAQPGLALLRLRRGNADGAAVSIARALSERANDPLACAKLLPAQVEIALARSDLQTARTAVLELNAIADACPSTGIRAAALSAAGALAAAEGDMAGATLTLRRALGAWNEIGVPYEAARVRGSLAAVHEAEGDVEQAALERNAAEQVFVRLGATLDLTSLRGNHAHAGTHARPAPTPRTVASRQTGLEATFLASAGSSIGPGTLIDGKIDLVREIGSGAMGAVFEGRHRVTGRSVAVKVVHAALCGQADHCNRLLQEALACGRIRHSHVIDVYDAGIHAGVPYLVMELLQGETVSALLQRRGRLELADAIEIVCQALDGVAMAHDQGVVHRDLKPANLFVATSSESVGVHVKVLDFGISKLASDALTQTKTGSIMGTPYYMAPEQAQSSRGVDARADIYSMAAVLYELLTGEPPFVASNYPTLILKIVTEPFPSARATCPSLPVGFDALLRRAGSRVPEERPQTAREFAAALRATAT